MFILMSMRRIAHCIHCSGRCRAYSITSVYMSKHADVDDRSTKQQKAALRKLERYEQYEVDKEWWSANNKLLLFEFPRFSQPLVPFLKLQLKKMRHAAKYDWWHLFMGADRFLRQVQKDVHSIFSFAYARNWKDLQSLGLLSVPLLQDIKLAVERLPVGQRDLMNMRLEDVYTPRFANVEYSQSNGRTFAHVWVYVRCVPQVGRLQMPESMAEVRRIKTLFQLYTVMVNLRYTKMVQPSIDKNYVVDVFNAYQPRITDLKPSFLEVCHERLLR